MVLAIVVRYFVADAERTVREMTRVLRPGGRLAIDDADARVYGAAKSRLPGLLSATTWRTDFFSSALELTRFAIFAYFHVADVRVAIYFPLYNMCADGLRHLMLASLRGQPSKHHLLYSYANAAGSFTETGMTKPISPPLLGNKHYREASAFAPENLLREARRQKGLGDGLVPDVWVLDPDGDCPSSRFSGQLSF